MYKLVVVAGKLRGEEYSLENGENSLGRDENCDIPFLVKGVSKKHFSATVTGDVIYIQDLGSSNGTFLNGKAITRATAQNGDKIAIPDAILQVVFVKEKKIIVRKKVDNDDNDEPDYLTGGELPKSPFAKILHIFKYKLMKIVHGINEEYEWRVLFGILLAAFVVLNISLTIFPVLQDSKTILLHEVAKRGAHYAEEIGRINSRAMEQKNLDQVDTNFLDKEDGVESYVLFDIDGRIVRPQARLNQYIDQPFAIQVKEWANKYKNDDGKRVVKKILKGGIIGIGKKIMAYDARTASFEPVGVIAIRFAPRSLAVEATKSSKAYLESLVTSFIVAIIFFGVIYHLTIRPVEEMKFQIEEALRGKIRNLESNYLMNELKPLRNSINSILQKNRELSSDGAETEFSEEESDDSYVATLGEFLRGSHGATLVLDSEKNLSIVNTEGEDLTGIRGDASQGVSLLDCCREKGFAATIIELCDESASGNGVHAQGEYDIQGNPYEVNVTSLMGKDGFAKAFYVTFVKEA